MTVRAMVANLTKDEAMRLFGRVRHLHALPAYCPATRLWIIAIFTI